ncbi:hypothetical protein JX266_011501 [Neoarthrinium moseri]|nr:hypothetical protein JX266_011501 [Neoarthrinium moseri]
MAMQSPPASSGDAEHPFDASKPFAGVVVCCTSIPADQRTEIANRVQEWGGIHKYDLTPDVTHLVVGDYDTPKYRHVARERPDIKAMAAGWIDAVRALWTTDQEINFAELEAEHQLKTFESSGGFPSSTNPQERERGRLLVCLTGFEEHDRHYIEETVKANGGSYVGDLSRRVTHLIVCKPEGKKYQAAKNWNIITVSIEWLNDSVTRGMILDEARYDPLLPKEQIGRGAIIKKEMKRAPTVKRPREGANPEPDNGRRKLRKSASMRLSSQSLDLWNDILGSKQPSVDASKSMIERSMSESNAAALVSKPAPMTNAAPQSFPLPQPSAEPTQPAEGIFASCRFYIHGFSTIRHAVARDALTSHGGQVSKTLEDVASGEHTEPTDQRFLVVPQTSQPDTHPRLPEGVHIVTEFYIERCIYGKQLLHPNEHVLGRPFPRFPIDGFQELTICTAGLRDEQLYQVVRSITQLGATYSEKLNKTCSVLVCPSVADVRPEKIDCALAHKVPIVHADWLWQCISTGFRVPWDGFTFPELQHRLSIDIDPDLQKGRQKLQRSRSEPARRREAKADFRAPAMGSKVDTSAFAKDQMPVPAHRHPSPEGPKADVARTHGQEDSSLGVSNYDTALTHQNQSVDGGPLSELHHNALNQSPPSKSHPPRKSLRRYPTEGTIGDSEGGDDSDAATVRGGSVAPEKGEPSASQAEKVRKRVADEESRKALASRLTSLMDKPTMPAPVDSPNPYPAPAVKPQRRKREIFGRAISNVSAASSASVESTGPSNLGSKPMHMDRVKSAPGSLGLLDMMGNNAQNAEEGEGDDANPPPATQIGYDDPKARQHRRAVMDRIEGNGGATARGTSTAQSQSQERITMESLRTETAEGIQGTAASRRPRRR